MITCENIWERYECLTLKESVLPIWWQKKKPEDTAGINNSRWFIYRALQCMVRKKRFPRAAAAWHSTRPVPGSLRLFHGRFPLLPMLHFLLQGQQLLSLTLFLCPTCLSYQAKPQGSPSPWCGWDRLRATESSVNPNTRLCFITDVLPVPDKQFNIHSFIQHICNEKLLHP